MQPTASSCHTLLYYVAGNPLHYLALSIRFHLRWRNACVQPACVLPAVRRRKAAANVWDAGQAVVAALVPLQDQRKSGPDTARVFSTGHLLCLTYFRGFAGFPVW